VHRTAKKFTFENEPAPTPAPVVDEEEPVDSENSVAIPLFFRYFLLAIVFLVVPSALFILCGGRDRLRRWIREGGIAGKKVKRGDGYQRVAGDLEK